MTEQERALATLRHNIRANFWMPLILFVTFMSWLRGWKVDPKRTEHNPLLTEERFIKDGTQYYRHGSRTWIIGQIKKN